MEYVKGIPFFCKTKDQIKSYPYLTRDIKTEILIVGGGIDGAIANFYLSKTHDVCLVDKSRFGYGSTSIATALLEYQLDNYAKDLKTLSNDQIVKIYNMGLKSIEKIEQFVNIYGNHCGFRKVPSLIYTTKAGGVKALKNEYEFRRKNDFKAQLFLNESPFEFDMKAGLYCSDGGAECNPYLLMKQMVEESKNQDKMFEFTKIDDICEGSEIVATTNFGYKIYCKKIILATGFNFELMRKKSLCERVVSYTVVTKPIKDFQIYKNTLLQDDVSPYHYIRLLPDKRIMIGGEDTPFKEKAINANKAEKKYKKLVKYLEKLFPELKKQIEIECKFCGCFASTDNNMGLIGKTENKNVLYLISCGANGIINAMFGAEMLEDIINDVPNEMEDLFSPLRE